MATYEDSSVGDFTLVGLYRSFGMQDIGEDAATEFTQRYMEKLVSLIRANMSSKLRSQFEPEDVAQSVLKSWFDGVRNRRISPKSSAEIWALISVIALNKIRSRVRAFQAQKREGSRVRVDLIDADGFLEPELEDAGDINDFLEELGKRLTPRCQEVLRLTLEGQSVQEIATQLDVVTKTIQRSRKYIRKQALAMLPEDMREMAQRMLQQSADNDNRANPDA